MNNAAVLLGIVFVLYRPNSVMLKALRGWSQKLFPLGVSNCLFHITPKLWEKRNLYKVWKDLHFFGTSVICKVYNNQDLCSSYTSFDGKLRVLMEGSRLAGACCCTRCIVSYFFEAWRWGGRDKFVPPSRLLGDDCWSCPFLVSPRSDVEGTGEAARMSNKAARPLAFERRLCGCCVALWAGSLDISISIRTHCGQGSRRSGGARKSCTETFVEAAECVGMGNGQWVAIVFPFHL